MSYNISHIEVTVLDAWMTAKNVVEAARCFDLPEIHFLEDIEDAADTAILKRKPQQRIQLRGFDWGGEGSGRSFKDVFVEQIAPMIRGKLEAVCIWEGGDSKSAFVIEDGVYEECDVEVKIKRPRKKKAAKK